jgi:hypothetical protein
MRSACVLSTRLLIAGLAMSAAFYLPAQEPGAQDKGSSEAQAKETQIKGMPPRVAPTEYQAHAKAGEVTIGAEFMGHSIPTPEHIFSTEDYIIVEAGLFGPPDAHTKLSRDDFSLRINGKKIASSSEPFELVSHTLKDPEWQPPKTDDEKESKSSLTTGGGGQGGDKLPPIPPKMPFPLRRAMEQQVHKSFMEEGDRPLPQAGLLFFSYHGKAENIRSLELIYNGAAGMATLDLQP